jgi:hypothetical protein
VLATTRSQERPDRRDALRGARLKEPPALTNWVSAWYKGQVLLPASDDHQASTNRSRSSNLRTI